MVKLNRRSEGPKIELFGVITSKIKDNLVYMLWPIHGEAHPVTFTINDFDSIMGSGKVFARKFDNRVDNEILKKLESELLKGADL